MNLKKLFDRSLALFLVFGAVNTLLSMLLMQALLGVAGYWAASAIAFLLTGALSFYLNKRYAFQSKASNGQTAWRFALVVGVCYGIAYGLAKPATAWLLGLWGAQKSLPVERIALLVGQVLYTGLNYLGQRFFAFRNDR